MVILEGIVTTLDEEGRANISPMGPLVDPRFRELVLRPFQSSRTYRNLVREGEGVFHVVDDVELLAHAAVGEFAVSPPLRPCPDLRGVILEDACRWYAFRVLERDDRGARSEMRCQVVSQGRLRDFFGFNRAKHAVVEAAILATRIGIVPDHVILGEFERLAVPVRKTAGDQERRAFEFLSNHVQQAMRSAT